MSLPIDSGLVVVTSPEFASRATDADLAYRELPLAWPIGGDPEAPEMFIICPIDGDGWYEAYWGLDAEGRTVQLAVEFAPFVVHTSSRVAVEVPIDDLKESVPLAAPELAAIDVARFVRSNRWRAKQLNASERASSLVLHVLGGWWGDLQLPRDRTAFSLATYDGQPLPSTFESVEANRREHWINLTATEPLPPGAKLVVSGARYETHEPDT